MNFSIPLLLSLNTVIPSLHASREGVSFQDHFFTTQFSLCGEKWSGNKTKAMTCTRAMWAAFIVENNKGILPAKMHALRSVTPKYN